MLMGNLMEIHVYTLLRLSHLIYFYIDAKKFLIEICNLPVCFVFTSDVKRIFCKV